jgi:predicted DNA-binding ribbon-helix-helix protein
MIRRPELTYQNTKRSVAVGQRKTSLRLEAGFWVGLKEIAAQERISIGQLVNRVDTDRRHANLSSATRLYVLDHFMKLASRKTDDPPTE